MLVKEVKNRNREIVLYPKFIYCYKSLSESLQEMIKRPDFLRSPTIQILTNLNGRLRTLEELLLLITVAVLLA